MQRSRSRPQRKSFGTRLRSQPCSNRDLLACNEIWSDWEDVFWKMHNKPCHRGRITLSQMEKYGTFHERENSNCKHCSKYKNLGFLPPQKETLPCQARPTLCDYSEVKRCSKLCRYSPLFLRPSKLLSCQRVWVPTGHKQFTQAADVAEKLLVQRLFHKSILMFNNYNTSDKLQGGKVWQFSLSFPGNV